MRLVHLSLLASTLVATPADAVMRGAVTRDPNGIRGSAFFDRVTAITSLSAGRVSAMRVRASRT